MCGAVEDYEAMVAGPVTGAEGDEQTGRELPDLRLWPEFGIPAQRAEQTPTAPGTQGPLIPPRPRGALPEPVPALPAMAPPSPQAPAAEASSPAQDDPGTPVAPAIPATFAAPAASTKTAELSETTKTAELSETTDSSGTTDSSETSGITEPAEVAAPEDAAAVLGSVPSLDAFPRQTSPEQAETGGGEDGPGGDDGADPDGNGGAQPPRPGWQRRSHRRSPMRRQTATAIVFVACLAVTFLVLHRFLPDIGGVGSLLETWLPWLGVPLGVLLVAAAIVHTRRAVIATLAAALVWTALYGPALLPRGSSAPGQLRVFSEDVNGKVQEATESGTMALAEHADVVALEDMYSSVAATSAVKALNAAYRYHVTGYEFGLWSKYPITNASPVELGTTAAAEDASLGTDQADLAASASAVPVIGALKATLTTPHGPLVVYLVHLPQPVLGDQGFAKARDAALTQFVALLKQDHSPRIAVIGPINVAATDRQFSQLTKNGGLTSAQQAAGGGYGFTWPAEFPIVRLDDVLTRGLTPLRSVVLPAIVGGQTHLPIQVDLDY